MTLLQGSRVKADQDVTLKAEGDILVTPNQVENYAKFQEEKSGFMDSSSMELDESDTVTNDRPQIEAGQKVALNAKNDVTLQSAHIESGGETEITAREGKVSMLVSKDSEYKHKVKTDMGFLTWSSSDKGSVDETVLHNLIDAGGGLTITTPEGVVVEFKESTGDVRKDAELLSNVQGLEWMGDLLDRDDVDWVAVQEIHDQWSKSDGGLGPGGMLIISIIASAVTSGVASSMALSAMGLEFATINGTTTLVLAGTETAASSMQMAMYTAITAGITSLSAQVATSLADAAAGGDLGENLSGIASINGLRSLAATMIMAGTLNAGASSGTFAEMGKAGEYMATTAIQTATNTIVGGEDLKESFLSAVGSAFGRYSAGKIDASGLDFEMKVIMHGVAGAARAAATGSDPYAGALGAIVGELAASATDQVLFDGAGGDGGTGSVEGKTILASGQIAAVLAASLAGVDMEDAASSASNAILNNYLMPQEKKELVDKLEACGDDAACKQEVVTFYQGISDPRDEEFSDALQLCATGHCAQLMELHWSLRWELTQEGIDYYSNHSDEFVKVVESKSVYHTAKINHASGAIVDIWESNGNTKYVHPIYGYEVVVKSDGSVEYNAINIGTYNLYNESGYDSELITSGFNHFLYDIAPYYILGNNLNDLSSGLDKISLTLKSLLVMVGVLDN